MRYRNDPEGTRLPVKLDTATNGEFAPMPLGKVHHHANRLALERGEYRNRPDPTFLTYGPKTRREFLNLKAWGG